MIEIIPISEIGQHPDINFEKFTTRVRVDGVQTIQMLKKAIYFIDDEDGVIIRSMQPNGAFRKDVGMALKMGVSTTFLYFDNPELSVRFIMSYPEDILSVEKAPFGTTNG